MGRNLCTEYGRRGRKKRVIEAVCSSLKGFTVSYYERWKHIQAIGKKRETHPKARDWQLVKTFGLGVLDEDNRTVELWEVAESVMAAYGTVQAERQKHEMKGIKHASR